MSCCGQRRRALSSSPQAAASPVSRVAIQTGGPVIGGVVLRYRGLGAYTMRSQKTGRLYACGGSGASLQVDAADVDALLRTRLFTRA
jgi:hypothetical protein